MIDELYLKLSDLDLVFNLKVKVLCVVFIFDDGLNEKMIFKVLEIFKRYNVKVIFFVMG